MTAWTTTYISAVVHQAGDNPIINEQSTTVTICDEAGGAFVSLTDSEGTTIKLDPEEMEMVCDVARNMLKDFHEAQKTWPLRRLHPPSQGRPSERKQAARQQV